MEEEATATDLVGLWGVSSVTGEHSFEFVRDLAPLEVAELEDARQLLGPFTTSRLLSGVDELVQWYTDAARLAFESPSESTIGAALERCKDLVDHLKPLSKWVSSLPDELAGRITTESSVDTLFRHIDGLLYPIQEALAEKSSEWRVTADGLRPVGDDAGASVDSVISQALEQASYLELTVVDVAATELDNASLLIRRLAAEVLRGTPVTMAHHASHSSGPIRPHPLPLDQVAQVQSDRATASKLLRQGAAPEHVDRESKLPDSHEELPTTKDVPVEQVPRNDGSLPAIQPSFSDLVAQLQGGLDDFLSAWCAAIDPEKLAHDSSALAAAVGALGDAAIREMEAHSPQTTLEFGYPTPDDDLSSRNFAAGESAEDLIATGHLGLIHLLTQELGRVGRPYRLQIENGALKQLSYLPSSVQRLIDLAEALATCLHPDERPEPPYWSRLAARSLAHGLIEASVLYSLIALRAAGPFPLGKPAEELLLSMLGNASKHSRASIVPYAQALLRRTSYMRSAS